MDPILFEQSMFNFVKTVSLENHRDDPSAKFDQQAIHVQTKPNSGLITTRFAYYTLKCCFLSIKDGLVALNIYTSLSAFNLMQHVGFLEFDTMIDTDNMLHKQALTKLANWLGIQLEFFFGTCINNKWHTTPDPSVVIGKSKNIIKILNKGNHFELITTPAKDFIYIPKTMTHEKVAQKQNEIMKAIKQISNDKKMALQSIREERHVQQFSDNKVVNKLQQDKYDISKQIAADMKLARLLSQEEYSFHY